MNLPNKLSLARIILAPVFVAFFYLPYEFAPYVAVGIFLLAAFTDFLDGHIARKRGLVTDLGKLLDPIADKLLVTCALFCVTSCDTLQYGPLPNTFVLLAVCSAVIVSRELLVSGVRQIAAAKGKVVAANVFGKIKTVVQDVALPLLVLAKASEFAEEDSLFFNLVWLSATVTLILATLLTIISGVIYLIQNRKIFKEEEQ